MLSPGHSARLREVGITTILAAPGRLEDKNHGCRTEHVEKRYRKGSMCCDGVVRRERPHVLLCRVRYDRSITFVRESADRRHEDDKGL